VSYLYFYVPCFFQIRIHCLRITIYLNKTRTGIQSSNFSVKQTIRNRSRSYKTFFSSFFFFGIKLGHFTINIFFCMLQTHKLTSKKRRNSSLAKKKSLVGSTPGWTWWLFKKTWNFLMLHLFNEKDELSLTWFCTKWPPAFSTSDVILRINWRHQKLTRCSNDVLTLKFIH